MAKSLKNYNVSFTVNGKKYSADVEAYSDKQAKLKAAFKTKQIRNIKDFENVKVK